MTIPDMDICDDLEFRPLTPCTFGVLCSALCVLAIVAQLVLFIHNYFIPPRCYHSGYLPFTFFISCLLQILIIFLPIGYLLYTATHLNLPITVFLIAHSVYWIFSLCSHIAARNFVEHPLLLVLLDSAILLLSIVPIFFWQTWFYDESGRFSTKVVTFYGLELLIVVLLFTLMVTRSTIRQTDMSSVWAGFSKKCALSWPYIWPRSSFLLQARVIVCLLLLVFGRIVNVALPLYSKWIVDELSHPASSVYNLIVISCVLKFLQGNGAMGGFLNTMRTYLWIPVQQYTTYQIQVELFTHLHNLSLSWHLSRKTGQVLRIMDRGTSSINSVLSYLLFNVFPTIFDILIAVIFFFSSYYSYFGVLVLLTMSIYLGILIPLDFR
ncbi:hypothetical protein AB6A40_003354 [Gnathostoma spinigerum]|uniref:ABC transmembrane type-1 domain-containing protein n=1 Tax=Gnathostoma spinigerum TaxID=75299 RepID=A0ABD6EAI1_9BILA